MSDLSQSAPGDATKPDDVAASSVPTPTEQITPETQIEVPVDPVAQAADRAGFKFLAIGFAIFFAIIAVCAGIVALVMKNMGI